MGSACSRSGAQVVQEKADNTLVEPRPPPTTAPGTDKTTAPAPSRDGAPASGAASGRPSLTPEQLSVLCGRESRPSSASLAAAPAPSDPASVGLRRKLSIRSLNVARQLSEVQSALRAAEANLGVHQYQLFDRARLSANPTLRQALLRAVTASHKDALSLHRRLNAIDTAKRNQGVGQQKLDLQGKLASYVGRIEALQGELASATSTAPTPPAIRPTAPPAATTATRSAALRVDWIRASSLGARACEVEWCEPLRRRGGGSNTYALEHRHGAAGPWAASDHPVDTPSLRVELREPAGAYQFRVRALDREAKLRGGFTPPCELVFRGNGKGSTTPVPVNLSLVQTGTTRCAVAWENSPNDAITAYRIESRCPDGNGDGNSDDDNDGPDWRVQAGEVGPGCPGDTLAMRAEVDVEPGRSYQFRVRTANASGWSCATTARPFLARDLAPPAVHNLRCEQVTHATCLLAWDEAAPLPGLVYELSACRQGSTAAVCGEGDWQALAAGLHSTRCRKRNLLPGTSYSFRVRAGLGGGWGPPSNVVVCETLPFREAIGALRETAVADLLTRSATSLSSLPQLLASILQRTPLAVSRTQVLADTMRLLGAAAPLTWATGMDVRFAGEVGEDYGALSREWLQLLVEAFTDPDQGLFRSVATASGVWHPALPPPPAGARDARLAEMGLLGRALARAVLHDVQLATRFSAVVYDTLLGHEVGPAHLRAFDPALDQSLTWMLDHSIEGVLEETFVAAAGSPPRDVELKPGGAAMAVTDANKADYVRLRSMAALCHGIGPRLAALHDGFCSLLGPTACAALSAADLERVLCGVSTISAHDWRRHALVDDVLASEYPAVVRDFWQIVADFGQEQRLRLLQFATACARVPEGGFQNLRPLPFSLKAMVHAPPGALPVAHSCFCQLELPVQDHDYERLRTKLLQAVTETDAFALA